MAKPLSDQSISDIRQLIHQISKYPPHSAQSTQIERHFITQLKRADSMYFLNTKDIDKAVSSMADKFMFHGFFRHAEYLKLALNRYIDRNLSESDLTPRLNVVKFLLCMSESPTTLFWQHPEQFDFIRPVQVEEEVIDWKAYLNEGFDTWQPANESSASDSDQSEHEEVDQLDGRTVPRAPIKTLESVTRVDFTSSRTELLDLVQHGWFSEQVCMQPPSLHFQANVSILWEAYLRKESHGLVAFDSITVISEYKVMREIMWQLWGPHASVVFEMDRDRIRCRKNVTISSVRMGSFTPLMEHFLSYIELLHEFRQFHNSLIIIPKDTSSCKIPETYKSYSQSIQRIISPILSELVAIEQEIREQETSMTLLKLADRLENLFKPVKVLKEVHLEVIGDFSESATKTSLECALTLLSKLGAGLAFSLDKLEQDVRLTLFLESFAHYFHIIEAWLVKNDFNDYTQEFIIEYVSDKDDKSMKDWMMNFKLRECDFNGAASILSDGLIRIICEKVLQIGRNIHFLRLLGKYDVFTKESETIHDEFLRRVLEELCRFYNHSEAMVESILDKADDEEEENEETEDLMVREKSSVHHGELGEEWSSYVDLSDGFLSKAFEHFDVAVKKRGKRRKLTLFEKISALTKNLFPLHRFHETIFARILDDRFTISGLLVKNLLLQNYHLDRQFAFLNHLFLFGDDLIFPFYIRLFDKMTMANSNWGNSVWLTSHLQDVLLDVYPTFCERCTVQVQDYWKECCDSIEALGLLQLNYGVVWPLDMIITRGHLQVYRRLFGVVLKVKWALYVLNRLWFAELERRPSTTTTSVMQTAANANRHTNNKKLHYLRFALINLFNGIQHFVFGSVIARCRMRFEADFHKANDLNALIAAHDRFINAVECQIDDIMSVTNSGEGTGGGAKTTATNDDTAFINLLKCVKMLKIMWNKREYSKHDNLEKCHRMYKMSASQILSHINPTVSVFD